MPLVSFMVSTAASPWQSRRGSSFIWGVWHDAKYVADQIAIQRSYLDHHEQATLEASAASV